MLIFHWPIKFFFALIDHQGILYKGKTKAKANVNERLATVARCFFLIIISSGVHFWEESPQTLSALHMVHFITSSYLHLMLSAWTTQLQISTHSSAHYHSVLILFMQLNLVAPPEYLPCIHKLMYAFDNWLCMLSLIISWLHNVHVQDGSQNSHGTVLPQHYHIQHTTYTYMDSLLHLGEQKTLGPKIAQQIHLYYLLWSTVSI